MSPTPEEWSAPRRRLLQALADDPPLLTRLAEEIGESTFASRRDETWEEIGKRVIAEMLSWPSLRDKE